MRGSKGRYSGRGRCIWSNSCSVNVRDLFLGRFFLSNFSCFVQIKRSASRASRVYCKCLAFCNRASVFGRLSTIRFRNRSAFRLFDSFFRNLTQRQPWYGQARRACLSAFFTYVLRNLLYSAYAKARDCGRMFDVFYIGLLMTYFFFFSFYMFDLRIRITLLRSNQVRFR